jgi:hypothetical protein
MVCVAPLLGLHVYTGSFETILQGEMVQFFSRLTLCGTGFSKAEHRKAFHGFAGFGML